MIKSKDDLKYYLEADKVALKIPSSRKYPRLFFDEIWKFEILLRKAEYHKNSPGMVHRLFYFFFYFRFKRLGGKLLISMNLNNFGPGLSIAHYGGIVVHPAARIGKNCRIHEGVTIGATNGDDTAATIGDNCFVGTGAKIIGSISIADDVAIGAGAVVIKDVAEPHVTVGGVPAKIISTKGSGKNVIRATECVNRYE